jgi:multidrug efflux pump subunit AcrA (membrane-fusion protein)
LTTQKQIFYLLTKTYPSKGGFIKMKKWIIGVVIIAVLVTGAYLVFGDGLPWAAASEQPAETEAVLPAVEAAREVVAEAKVVPVQYATLSLATGGIVSQLLVTEGENVEAGQGDRG